MKLSILFVPMILLLSACAHVFSQQEESLVDPAITFQQLKKDPNAFIGKYVKFGGIIVATKNMKEGSRIEVVQFGLGRGDLPDEEIPSGGRFLATSPDYLDAMIYKTGRPVAVIGQVKGEMTLPLSEIEYSYPVISISDIHVWKKSAEPPYPPYPAYFYRGFYGDDWWYGPPYWYGPGWGYW